MKQTGTGAGGLTRRGLAGVLGAVGLAPLGALPVAAEGVASANLAMVGEPQSLDPMASTADLVGTIMQHVYEPLYTFDADWVVRPMLAAALPDISADGRIYAIPLREGVTLHNGRTLDAEDVVASLKRWMEMTPRGKSVARGVVGLTAKGAGVEIALSAVNPALLAHLALPSGFAAIMAKEAIATPLAEFVGTGPYKFRERRPDQFVVLVRHDAYAPRPEAPSGYAGRREAKIAELRFVPVPNANTRVEGVVAGQYHFADQLPVESSARIARASGVVKPVLTMPFGFPYLVLNTKQGACANLKVRQALQMSLSDSDLLTAAFGDDQFFEATASHFPKGSPFHSEAGAGRYDRGDAAGAKKLLAEAGYDGAPIRILNSKQYDFHNRMAVVMAEALKAAGLKVQLDVVDWATLVSRRGDPALWDVYVTHSAFLPEPMLSPPQLGDDAPGWWNTPAKQAAIAALNAEPDAGKRGALWGRVQEAVYDEVPYIRVGNFAALSGLSAKLKGFSPMPWPAFWNVEPA